jgi:hypothetical protein
MPFCLPMKSENKVSRNDSAFYDDLSGSGKHDAGKPISLSASR